MHYIINGANVILSDREMRMVPKHIQVLCTNVLQAIVGVHSDCCLVGLAMIINEQCEKIEAALQATGVNMKYALEPVPAVHLSRRIPHEPEVHGRDTKEARGKSDDHWGGTDGPKEEQPRRTTQQNEYIEGQPVQQPFLRIMQTQRTERPTQANYPKEENGEFLNPANKTTTVHDIFRNMCVDDDSAGTGTGRPPFAAVVPIRSGRNEGSSTLVFFDDSKGKLTGKVDKTRETAGPISMANRTPENENSVHFTYMHCRDKLGLRRSLFI